MNLVLKQFAQHVDNFFANYPSDDVLIKFQRSVVDDAREAEERVRRAGLNDETVIVDLVKAAHPDLKSEYEAFRKVELRSRREKRFNKILAIATPCWLVAMIIIYLAVGFIFDNWRESWLIIIGFVTVLVDVIAYALVSQLHHRRMYWHPLARVAQGLAIMMTTTFVYLYGLMVYNIPDFWVMFPLGVILLFVGDSLLARFLGQKLRIINYLLYIPACAAMVFVILGGLHIVPWNPGWLIVILGVVLDVLLVVAKLINNRKYIYRPGDDE